MADRVHLNGVDTWYDERGAGDTIVLLHGGLTDSRDFDGNLDTLTRRFRCLFPERRGHGHTADVDGPITADLMAADTVEFLERIVGRPVPLVGYSAGAIVALWVAVRRPRSRHATGSHQRSVRTGGNAPAADRQCRHAAAAG